ncbi:MAG: hypothetical protein JWP74_3646 [Marmoricola sp.]|nr:hypothetical protein [Marmoricola sp.]
MRTKADSRRTGAMLLCSLTVTVLGGALIAVLPHLVGVSWSAIGATLGSIPVPVLLGLVALWFAGLGVHVIVLMAAMKGLTARQALALNLSGSAVSNLIPLGGPAGVGLGYGMARSWGFGCDQYASYTVATNVWNALGKFLMGTSVLATAALLGTGLPSGLGSVVLGATAFVAFGGGVAGLTLRTERTTVAAGQRVDRWIAAVRRHDEVTAVCSGWLLNSRRELGTAVRSGWKRMSLGVLCYLVLQAALLLACMAAVGAHVTVGVAVIAFAIERLISLAPITPGASGIAEIGTVAALHSFGVDPVAAAAGVLLYRTLMFGIQIPIGGAIGLGWLAGVRRQRALLPKIEVVLPEAVVLTSPQLASP